ncbi:unnamed protein product [Pseudo-nitzschia multistriata]|uniref:Short-chain dehydrogenase/reductase SDR n=1 Tax=Pseudo-nitzschia multistriata TaxID=183589 RepID=A0A448Z940_9STRA|nr:unnamed protein product [Pseudo-nitzschia multistriata]
MMKSIGRKTCGSMSFRRLVEVAGAGALLLSPSCSNAFAGASSFSRPIGQASDASLGSAAQRQYSTTKLLAVGEVAFPKPVSVAPGESPVEEQPSLNPIDDSCTILVVGSSRGIGLEFVKQCLDKGATVIAAHFPKETPDTLSELKSRHQGKLHTIHMNLEDEESISSAASELTGMENLPSLTHIIHNAGIYLSGASFDGTARAGRAATAKVTKEVLMKTFEVNTVAPLLIAQSFVPLLQKRSESLFPVMAFVSSKVGSVDDNGSGGAYAYRSSKCALNQVAKSLSVDLADEARVVLLHPGWVRTDMTNGNGLIDTDESVSGMLKAVEATDASTGFRFVDYKACQIPW